MATVDLSKSETGDRFLVEAWDRTGTRRIVIPVQVGDEITWKRRGSIGLVTCRVCGLRPKKDGSTSLYVTPLNSVGSRWISSGVSAVFRNGERVYE